MQASTLMHWVVCIFHCISKYHVLIEGNQPGCIPEKTLSWFILNNFILQAKSLPFLPQSAASFYILKYLLGSFILSTGIGPRKFPL